MELLSATNGLAQEVALMVLTALGLPGDPVHEAVHGRPTQTLGHKRPDDRAPTFPSWLSAQRAPDYAAGGS